MTRPLRIEYKGALYHVLSRGNQQQDIFLGKSDRIDFLELIEELVERFNLEIYAFVLMSNHYHILLKTLEPNLSKSMQWLGTTYTRRYNNRHQLCGHLFQGRYKSIIVQNDAYLLNLSYYIHRNPLRANMVERLADYEWSSYRYYAYKRKSPNWLSTSTILNQFKNIPDIHKAYRSNAQQYSDEQNKLSENIRYGLVYGSQAFIDKIKDKYLSDTPDPALSLDTRMYRCIDAAKLIKKITKILDCNLEEFKKAVRISQSEKDKRDILIYMLCHVCGLSNNQIAEHMGIGYSAVSRRISIFRRSLKEDFKLYSEFKRVKSLIKL